MKKILALVLALVVAFAFASVAMAEEDDTILLGFASNASDENMNKQADAFCNYAEEWNAAGNTPRVETTVTVAEASVDKQLSDVDALIEMGCDVIYLNAVDLEGLIPAIDACNAAGVKVMETRGMTYEGIDVKLNGADEIMMAEMAFEWYDKLLTENPDLNLKMGLIYGLASQTAQLVRVDHLVELLQEKYPDRVEVLASQPCDWDAQKAMECIENWLQRFAGEMNCVVAAGAMMECGAAQAIIGAGEDLDNWVLTTTDSTADVLYAIHEGQVDMTVGIDPVLQGEICCDLCIKIATGEFTDSEYAIGSVLLTSIDSTNIDEWYVEE